MNQKFSSFLKLFLIVVCGGVFLNSCQDEPFDNHNHENQKSPYEISLEEFQQISNIDNIDKFLSEKFNNTNLMSRGSSTLFDFEINTESIYEYINENQTITSFSFRIFPKIPDENDNFIYNLLILKINENWETSILQLEKSIDETSQNRYASITEIYTSTGLPNLQGRLAGLIGQQTTYHYHCTGTGACAGGVCDKCKLCVSTKITYSLVYHEDNPVELVEAIVNENPRSGGGSTPNISTIVSDNCNDLKTKSANPNFNATISDFNIDAANSAVETAKVMYKNAPNYSPKSYGGLDNNGNSYVKLTPDPNRTTEIIGFMHCHSDVEIYKNLAVFSISDFIAFGKLIENSTANVSDYIAIVTGANGTFALKLTNKQALIDLKNYIQNPSTNREAEDNFNKLIENTMSVKNQIKGLLQFIQKTSTDNGIELYQRNNNNQWELKYLDSNNKVKTSKCA